MESKAEFLKQSLLYQMSLGSKELYHSNIWAWLIENDFAFVKAFFPDFDENTYEITGVSRECKHRDIIIWLHKKGFDERKEKYFYVIENKIKSLQSEEQLKDYSENLWNNIMLGGVVTGIRNALNENNISLPNKNANCPNVEWTFVSYENISKEISNIASLSKNRVIQDHLSQIIEYCQIIDSIYKVIGEAVDKNKNCLDYSCPDYLKDLRLKDIFVKLKGADFFRYISQYGDAIESLVPKEKGFYTEIWQSFHNGKATLDFRFTNWREKCDDYLTIGVQIEGWQYRLFVQRDGRHYSQELYDEFKDVWFDKDFDKSSRERTLFGKSTSLKKQFDSYGEGSGKYVMIYQYYNLNNELNAYEQLFAQIKSDLSKARDVILCKNY